MIPPGDAVLAHLARVAEEPDLGGTRYRVREILGRGGMGVVWLAEDVELEREVALKVLSDSAGGEGAAQRLLREARILARLEHPGIVPVHDAGVLPDGRAFYVMKRVKGRPLAEVIRERLPVAERLRLFERLCEAVAFAHARGIIHRDLKPSNVMAGEYGEVLVLDWGVAKLLAGGDDSAVAAAAPPREDATSEGAVIGTPGWMAPEQAAGRASEVGPRTDVWALGAVLHALLVGEPPDGSPRRVDRTIPRPLDAMVRHALAEDPGDRYASAGELRADVARFLDGLPVSVHRETAAERLARIARRHRVAIAIGLGYVVVRSLFQIWIAYR